MLQQRITIRRPDCALWVRLCCKSRFALRTKNSAGYRRGFRVKMWGPYRLTLNSQATSVTRLRLYESAIASRFVFSREIRSSATFDFCNTIIRKQTGAPQHSALADDWVSGQSENLPRIVWRRDVVAQDFDDFCRLLDQRRVARRHLALFQIDVVLEPDPRMAAEQHGLRHHGELMQRDAEGKPRRVRRQQIAHIGHRLGRRRLAPGYAEADLEHARRLDQAVLDEALGEQQMPRLEHFELGHHAGILDRLGHRLQVLWRVDEDAVAHVEAAHVEATNVRLELDHVAHAVFRRSEHAVGAGFCRVG